MNSRNIITTLFFVLFYIFSFDNVFGSFKGLETQIHSGSSESKIKKLQLTFNSFNLYNGNIDGKYESIKPVLLSYQLDNGIISSENDSSAGYFGVKTLSALKQDFPEKFDEVASSILQMDKPDTNLRYFYITAYYSPLPGQQRYSYNYYTKGYRNYTQEIRLQGDGKKTASGKDVYTGILAAPRNYDFGTKIELEGIGVGVVEDRGGAIVNSGERDHEYDRIDIWMGYGYDRLIRAEKWGKRKVLGKIVNDNTDINIEFADSNILEYSNLKVDAEDPKADNVIKLQELFKEIGLYFSDINGNFEDIKDILIKFQIDNKIIDNKYHPHAGYFGAKTYTIIKNKYSGDLFFKEKSTNLENNINLTLNQKRELNLILNKVNNLIDKKYGKNTKKSTEYREKLKQSLTNKIPKIKNNLTKAKLEYIKNLI